MKKVITFGDLHGRTFWKEFADIKFLLYAEPEAAGYGGFVPEYDYYIFVGDYCDSFTETTPTIINNLLELIRFKILYPNNVILLWGNHDIEYWLNEPWKPLKQNLITGFRPEAHFDLFEIFNKNKDLFQLAFGLDNYLWTHAGVHYGWYHFVFNKAIKDMEMNDMTVAEQLNEAFRYRLNCLFDIDWYRGGNKRVGGPLWCDKNLTFNKPLKNTHQIVGHTPVSKITTIKKNEDTSITYVDVLRHAPHKDKDNYYIVNI